MTSTRTPMDIGQWLRNAARTPDQHQNRIDHLDELMGLLVVREMLQIENVSILGFDDLKPKVAMLNDEINDLLKMIGEVSAAEFMACHDGVRVSGVN